MYLVNQDYTEYVDDYYDEDVAGIFGIEDYSIDYDYSSFGKKKRKKRSNWMRRGKRQAHLAGNDLFFSKNTDDYRNVG